MAKKAIVLLTPFSSKQLKKLPLHIREAFYFWVHLIENFGLVRTRKIPGYRDKILSGARKGQRSVRLNRGYRIFYTEADSAEEIELTVIGVNKHEY